MAISLARAQRHVREWSEKLAPYEARKWWPRYLYHACDVTVVRHIIESDRILSRNLATQGVGLVCDVANQGALWNNPAAHEFVRLYFRPKNSFHFKTEGIKSLSDPFRRNPHMSIPILFMFDFVELMSDARSMFLHENFANSGAAPLSGDDFFDSLRFDDIYHDSPVNDQNRDKITRSRMAEVVVPHELPLSFCKAILVRNPFDQRTVEHFCNGPAIGKRIYVDVRGGGFLKKGMYLKSASFRDETLIFCFNSPIKGPQQTYSVRVQHGSYAQSLDLPSGNWSIRTGNSAHVPVRIDIENALAFFGLLPAGENAVV